MMASSIEALTFIQEKVAEQIKGFDDSRKYYRRNYYYVTVIAATLSAVTTFLIGVGQIFNSTWISVIALGTSAAITIVTAWDGFFRNRDMWVQKTDTLMQLYSLDSNIKYALSSKTDLGQTEVDEFYRRFENILMQEHAVWKNVRSAQAGPPDAT